MGGDAESREDTVSANARRSKIEQSFTDLQSEIDNYYEKWYKSTGGDSSSGHRDGGQKSSATSEKASRQRPNEAK